MKRKSLIWIVAAVAATAFAANALAEPGHGHGHGGSYGRGRSLGHWIGRPGPVVSHRRVIVAPRRPVFVPLGPRFVVTPPPPVVVAPPKTVIVRPALPAPEPATITLWITNANGSQTSVVLTRQGPGYIGPRGEYYSQMPTQEQLRVVYGLGPIATSSDTVIIYIQGAAGELRPITLTKKGAFYVGPAGEYYPTLPTAEQLRMIYGD